jgi:hypothetical protein
VKKVRLTFCTFGTVHFFTRTCPEPVEFARPPEYEENTVTAAKRQNRAGATPLFCGVAAQKFRGVAPALRHEFSCRPFCQRHQDS